MSIGAGTGYIGVRAGGPIGAGTGYIQRSRSWNYISQPLTVVLFLDKSPIPVVEETKFLGVIFDRKLSFVPHLKYVKKKRFESP